MNTESSSFEYCQLYQFCMHSEINAKWKSRTIRYYLPTTNNRLYCFKSYLFWLHSCDWIYRFFSCYERSNESSNLKWTLFIEKHFIGNWCKYKENILKCDGYLWFPFYEKWKESEWVGLCDQRTIRSIGNATYKNGNHFIDIVLRKSQYLASIVMWMNIIRFARIHKVSYIKFILHTEHTPTSYSHTMTCKQ